jgi:hypothetical protein
VQGLLTNELQSLERLIYGAAGVIGVSGRCNKNEWQLQEKVAYGERKSFSFLYVAVRRLVALAVVVSSLFPSTD